MADAPAGPGAPADRAEAVAQAREKLLKAWPYVLDDCKYCTEFRQAVDDLCDAALSGRPPQPTEEQDE